MPDKVYVSGFQPPWQGISSLTLGNYLGAIKPLLNIQKRFPLAKIYVFVADLHALTLPNPHNHRLKISELFMLYLACGLDPQKIIFFQQSNIPAHTELAYLLLCHTTIGQLQRMTQFKAKSRQQNANKTNMIPTGLMIYPGLMAADVLLYDADYVVVGQDQQQHVELIRDLAMRFNHFYHNNIFKMPAIWSDGANTRIMSLKNPQQKMSKSETDPDSYILLLDSPEQIGIKIKQAITDSENKVYYDEQEKPAVSNLIKIYALLTDQTIKQVVTKFKTNNYQQFKTQLTDIIVEQLSAIQRRYHHYRNNPHQIKQMLSHQQSHLITITNQKLQRVKKLMGLI